MSYREKYKIFEKIIEINYSKKYKLMNETLRNQLAYYSKLGDNEQPNIQINLIDEKLQTTSGFTNPAIHKELEKGFITYSKIKQISYSFKNNKLIIDFHVNISNSKIIRFLRKMNQIGFCSREEQIGQMIFETVLIPAMFFDKDKFIVHASTYEGKNGAIMIGGTGGVGKTSLEINFCLNKEYNFISDDIAVVNEAGNVLPNLALPKIYGYNLINNKKLKYKMFKDLGVFNKIIWYLKYHFFGANKVRRKIALEKVYGKYTNKPVPLDGFFTLVREYRDDLIIEPISIETATEMNISVILSEYSYFINHINWHEFNCMAGNKTPIITLDSIRENWRINSIKALQNVKCYIIRIPVNFSHKKFVADISDMIDKM